MPYIKQEDRFALEPGCAPATPGELNYVFTVLVRDYLRRKDNNYENRNAVMGAAVGFLLEFYWREVRPYEDKKIKENGDVY